MAQIINPGNHKEGTGASLSRLFDMAKTIYDVKGAHDARAAKEDEAKGIWDKGKQLDWVKGGGTFVKEPTDQGVEISDREQGFKLWAVPPKPRAELRVPQRETYQDRKTGQNKLGLVGPDGRVIEDPNDSLSANQPAKERVKDTSAQDEWKLASARERAQKNLNNALEPYNAAIDASKEVTTLAELSKTNPTAAGALAAKIARAAGEKGILSDSDIKRYGGEQSVIANLERLAQRSYDGTLRAEDMKFASDLANAMATNAADLKKSKAESLVKQFTNNYKGNFNENYAIITGEDYAPQTAKVSGKEPPRKSGGGMGLLEDTAQASTKYPMPTGTVFEYEGKKWQVGPNGKAVEVP